MSDRRKTELNADSVLIGIPPKGKYWVMCQWVEEDDDGNPTTRSERIDDATRGEFYSWRKANAWIDMHVRRGIDAPMRVSFHIIDDTGTDVSDVPEEEYFGA
jgi:hypothetical protein